MPLGIVGQATDVVKQSADKVVDKAAEQTVTTMTQVGSSLE